MWKKRGEWGGEGVGEWGVDGAGVVVLGLKMGLLAHGGKKVVFCILSLLFLFLLLGLILSFIK